MQALNGTSSVKIYMDEQLLRYQLFSNPNVILHYGLADMTTLQLSHNLLKHHPFQLPPY